MGSRESLPGAGKTALGVAVVRARESLREDRLFNDPYAASYGRPVPGPSGGGFLTAVRAGR